MKTIKVMLVDGAYWALLKTDNGYKDLYENALCVKGVQDLLGDVKEVNIKLYDRKPASFNHVIEVVTEKELKEVRVSTKGSYNVYDEYSYNPRCRVISNDLIIDGVDIGKTSIYLHQEVITTKLLFDEKEVSEDIANVIQELIGTLSIESNKIYLKVV